MYFNEKSDTDINNDISKSKKKKKKRNNNIKNILKNKKIFLVMGIFIIVFIISLILIFTNNTEYYLELSGEEYIKIYEGSEYIEDANGYYAYDSNGNDLTNEVIIDSNLDINTIGEYTITYSIMDISKERYISVIEKPKIATYIHLKGEEVVYLSINEEYIDPGYTAIDTFDSNLTKKVKVTNNIDNTKAGIYKVTYSVTNSSGVTSSAVRKVIVMDSEVSLSLSNTNPTNSDVSIDIHITDNYYSYLILPNGEKITNKDYSYKVSSNGKYRFIIYNSKGKSVTKIISVTNIDKEEPTGSCSGYVKNGKSYITVNATDNVGISKYTVDGINSTSNIITLESTVTTQTVTIYDKAGNYKNIVCNLDKKDVSLKVATWNIGRGAKHGYKSGTFYGEKLADYDLDIVGLQEAKPAYSKQGSFNSFIKKISDSGNFGNYEYVNIPAGNAIVSKYKIISSNSYSVYNCGETRKLMKVVINVNGIDISFYNMHTAVSTCRYNQYESVSKIINDDPNPLIFVGDFNDNNIDTKFYDYFDEDNIIYGHSGYNDSDEYCDIIVLNGKGKINYVSDEYVYTKKDYTDHNLVITTFSVG